MGAVRFSGDPELTLKPTEAAQAAKARAAKTRVRIDAEVEKAKRQAKRQGLPSREALVTLALDVYKLALDKTVDWTNKKGEESGRASPDFKAATDALKVAAAICGYDRQAPAAKPTATYAAEAEEEAAVEAEEAADAEAALVRLRSKLVAKTPTTP